MIQKKLLIFLFLCFIPSSLFSSDTIGLTEAGLELKKFYDGVDISHLWLKGYKVDWVSGKALSKSKNQKSTHCSAFVASLLMQKNIYILRPPQHRATLLANAQFDWLNSDDAKEIGWNKVIGENQYFLAQKLGNSGFFVVAVTKNPNKNRPGHIAFVYPKEMTEEKIIESGPVLIQAGYINGKEISLKEGFKHHYHEWNLNIVDFFYYKDAFR